jgi:hypothetical protein
MAVNTPEWLTQRGGELRPAKDGRTYSLYLNGEPHYSLVPIPAGGKFACRVSQTINGKRLDGPTTYATLEEAVHGGLTDLQKALGW